MGRGRAIVVMERCKDFGLRSEAMATRSFVWKFRWLAIMVMDIAVLDTPVWAVSSQPQELAWNVQRQDVVAVR